MSFDYNLNFISLVWKVTVQESWGQKCVCHTVQWLLKISGIWAFEIISENRIILILHLTCQREGNVTEKSEQDTGWLLLCAPGQAPTSLFPDVEKEVVLVYEVV